VEVHVYGGYSLEAKIHDIHLYLDKMYIDSVYFVPPKEICKTYLCYDEYWVDETPEYIYIELTAKERNVWGCIHAQGVLAPE